ncbi:MAG TPA: hypothetical protein VNJ01_16210 [Bacteriovoracaceae bacterium]|nr:hypothetical protein [Bacteriovoracaceae bacterium]
MFYLTEFFKTLGESLLRGFFFLLLSCLLAFSLTHRGWIARTLETIQPDKLVNPYFVAVVDGTVDARKIKSVLDGLPGVVNVSDKAKESQAKLKALASQLGEEYSLDEDLMNFKSIRVVLSPSLSAQSLEFIREQVVKIGGREHVDATEIKYPEITTVMKAHPFYTFLAKAGDWGVVGIISLLWIICYWLCYDLFRSRSYIIEKFQRRKLVAAKTIATGLGVVVVLFAALGVWNGTLKFLDSVLLLMVFSVFWTFSMQDWKWKPTL